MRSSPVPWDRLQETIEGEVLLPGSPQYERARRPAIARFHDVRPCAVVLCRTPADVAETISLARRSQLPVVPRSGGHCFAGHSSTDGIVIDVSPMRSVSVRDGVALVGAGARLGDVYDSLAAHGLTLPAGCGPTVGVAGLTLGGGFGILGRRYGLTSDRLVGAQVVLADSRIVDCDDHHDRDLFWALRGAGGGLLGVVTSLAFQPVPAPPATSFQLVWSHVDIARMVAAWQQWAPAAPDELSASLAVATEGDAGRPAATVAGAMLGTESDATDLLGELSARAGVDPASTDLAHGSYREAKRHLATLGGEPAEETVHTIHRSGFVTQPLSGEAIAALVDNLSRQRIDGQSRALEFTPWGGAYHRTPVHATAFAHRDALFLVKHVAGMDPGAPAGQREAASRWLARSQERVRPWSTGGVYPNFAEPDLPRWAPAYHGTNLARLREVQARYDPDGFFH